MNYLIVFVFFFLFCFVVIVGWTCRRALVKAKVRTRPGGKDLATEISALYEAAIAARDRASAHAGDACRHALACGHLLLQAKAAHPGEFGLWIETNCPKLDWRTAQNWMRLANRFSEIFSDGQPDLQALQEKFGLEPTISNLYRVVGILPQVAGLALRGPEAPEACPEWWVRVTQRMDARISRAKPDERKALATEIQSLHAWCLAAARRLNLNLQQEGT